MATLATQSVQSRPYDFVEIIQAEPRLSRSLTFPSKFNSLKIWKQNKKITQLWNSGTESSADVPASMIHFRRSALHISIFPAAGIACCRNSNSFEPKTAWLPSSGNFSRWSNEHNGNNFCSDHLAFRVRFDRTGQDPTEIQPYPRTSRGPQISWHFKSLRCASSKLLKK